jgi:hypothetical protein
MQNEKRTELLRVKVAPSERARIEETAARHAMSVSTYVRFVALGGRFGRTPPLPTGEQPKGESEFHGND